MREKGPPTSKMVEYRTTRQDQLHEMVIWYAHTVAEEGEQWILDHFLSERLTRPEIVDASQLGLLAHGHEKSVIAGEELALIHR